MPEPFKNLLNDVVVRNIGARLQAAWPAFDRRGFQRRALEGLDSLELKARAMHLTSALESTLPPDFASAADVLERAIAGGLAGWALWPVGEYVARHGQASPQRGLQLLHALTPAFTAEWAIRPYIVNHPALAFETLARWAHDPDPHVRRLVSEGSRPRLPWGLQLKSLIADPSPTLPLLETLMDDDSDYVRRSVANHLNDIAKDHPHLVAEWVERHLPGASQQRRALLRHACRSLIKRGDPRVLHAWGQGAEFRGDVALKLGPRRLALGDSLTLEVTLKPRGRQAQSLVIDYAVHHVKANGSTSPKVFKGWALDLAAGEQRVLRKSHAVRPITTRRYFSGTHRVEVLVNGKVAAHAAFELRA
ncbi:DNA alkylation repair protein [Piscinibacter sp. XHJ-5]|uniref:DNA alkylation repair protein n=1 Tax=Piscinibacter sp. XHJ-5 TaxID=3037797 RepID=UPI0024530068|nr:DNA alkylation repair protein [Piscinibacter sp. XHJ-5]